MSDVDVDKWFKFDLYFNEEYDAADRLSTWVRVEDGELETAREKCEERSKNLWKYELEKFELSEIGYYEDGEK